MLQLILLPTQFNMYSNTKSKHKKRLTNHSGLPSSAPKGGPFMQCIVIIAYICSTKKGIYDKLYKEFLIHDAI